MSKSVAYKEGRLKDEVYIPKCLHKNQNPKMNTKAPRDEP